MEVLKGQTSDEIGSLKARNEQLETNLHQLKEQRDTWESDANFVREQLRDSEQRRHEAETKLDESERRRISLEAANVKTVKDIEQKDEQLKGWEVTMRLHWGKTEATQKELEHLRALKKQLLNLVANLRGGESST
jgi:chromosome segregation ATPase